MTEGEILSLSRLNEIAEAGNAVGLACAVVDREGNLLFRHFYGVRDRESGLPVNEDTIFGLASLTKSFTALSVLQLEEQGILSTEQPLSRYLPEFTNRNQGTVLLRHLLSHTGGFFPLPRILLSDVSAELGRTDSIEADFAYDRIIAEEGRHRVASRLDAQQVGIPGAGLNGAPGEYCSYCNDGYGLLGELVSLYGDQPTLADYVREHITAPLGMTRTSFEFMRTAADENCAALYKTREGRQIGDYNFHDDAFVLHGGGGMKSTLRDMTKYLTLLLREGTVDGHTYLSPASLRELETPRIPFDGGSEYCFGLYTERLPVGRVYRHGGGLPGVSSHIAFVPEAGIGCIVLCNTEGVAVGELASGLLCAVQGLTPPDPMQGLTPTEWSGETREKAAGHYASGEGRTVDLLPDGDSLRLIVDGKEQTLIPVGERDAVVPSSFGKTWLQLIENEARGLYAVRYGSRLIPRV